MLVNFLKDLWKSNSGDGNALTFCSGNIYCSLTSFCIAPFLLSLRISSSSAAHRGIKEIRNKTNIKKLSLELTIQELEVLLPLASDQLFRNQFIDTRFPGSVAHIPEIQSAKAVINRIKDRLYLAQHNSAGTARLSIRHQ